MSHGKWLEEWADSVLKKVSRKCIVKADPPVKYLHPLGKGRFAAHFKEKGGLDFSGSYCGRHVEIEAKDVAGSSLNFTDGKRVKVHQLDRLHRLLDDGAFAGFVIRFRPRTGGNFRIYLVHGSIIDWCHTPGKLTKNGRASIPESLCEDPRFGIELPPVESHAVPLVRDFLGRWMQGRVGPES